MKLPSRRIIALIIACGCILLAFYLVHRDKSPIENSYENENKGIGIAVEGALKKASAEDSDDDGLLNWEESIWNTDPYESDTDGDGTPDGAEVDAERNPTKKGPDDKIKTSSEVAASSTPLTSTDVLSREVFAQYIEARKSGHTVASSEQFVQALIAREKENQKPVFYTKTSLKVVNTTNDTTVRDYVNSLAKAMYLNNISRDENEISLYSNAINTNDEKSLNKLDPIISGYKQVIASLLLVPVPNSLANTHIQIINNYQLVLGSVEGFKKVFDDPIIGIVSLSQYAEASAALSDNFFDIQSTVDERGISFEQSEYGYMLMTEL